MKKYIAIDLGATSGRHIVGFKDENGVIQLEEIYRFPTGMHDSPDGLVWDLDLLFTHIKQGIKIAFEKYDDIKSLSIDTWGVDYVLIKDNKPVKPYYAYRNSRTAKRIDEVHAIVPFEKLYESTGMQFASFNTIYQLFDDLKQGRLEGVSDFLMIPEYFSYLLTGHKFKEYTNASTTGLINAQNKQFDIKIIDALGLPRHLFSHLSMPGTLVGRLKPEIANEVKGDLDVILCASHDTASAFEAVDCPDDAAIISSGTWSLLGVKSKLPNTSSKSMKSNFTNEGGVGYIRYLKNIMGMWIVNQISAQEGLSVKEMAKQLDDVTYSETFDVNDESLLAPDNMKQAVIRLLKNNPPKDDKELFASIYHSLALSYDKTIKELEDNLSYKYNSIYIVGGGANNKYLNKLTEQYTKLKVVALPIEATSLGNIKIQIKKYE